MTPSVVKRLTSPRETIKVPTSNILAANTGNLWQLTPEMEFHYLSTLPFHWILSPCIGLNQYSFMFATILTGFSANESIQISFAPAVAMGNIQMNSAQNSTYFGLSHP